MTRAIPDNDPSMVHPAIKFLKAVLPALLLLATAIVVLYNYSDTWPPIASVTSESMVPHLQKGDMVLIQSPEKANVTTVHLGLFAGYRSFGDYGDVIMYRPMGLANVSPVIHRAMYWVNQSSPMWYLGPPAPHSGFMTLGDANNGSYDQYPDGACPGEPVEEAWIIGVAKYRVPYLGDIRDAMPF